MGNMKVIVPNTFLAGATRCGTTSLFQYLRSHPNVCGPSQKETRYLIDEDYPLFKPESNILYQRLEGYRVYYKNYNPEKHRVILDATPDYLYQETPLAILPKWSPLPKVVFILRKPSERVYSMFNYAKNVRETLDSNISFDYFVHMIHTHDRYLEHKPILKNAIEHSKYIRYIEKWQTCLGKETIHVLLFEDMVSAPLRFMQDLCCRLDLDPSFYTNYSFRPQNASRASRLAFINTLKQKYGRKLPCGRTKRLIHEIFERFLVCTTATSKTDMDRRVMAQLDKLFLPYNQELKSVTNLNLDVWNHEAQSGQ